MPSSKRKSNLKPDNQTLHSFFGKPGSSRVDSPRSRSTTNQQGVSRKRVNTRPPSGAEIIVIDSDDETVPTPSPQRKGKRKSSISVDDIQAYDALSASTMKKFRRANTLELEHGQTEEGSSSLPSTSALRSFHSTTTVSGSTSTPAAPSAALPSVDGGPSSSSFSFFSTTTPATLLSSPSDAPALGSLENTAIWNDDVIELDDEWPEEDVDIAEFGDEDTENIQSTRSSRPCLSHVASYTSEKQDPAMLKRSTSTNALGGKSGTDVFSVLMSSHNENEVWREAQEAEDRSFRATKSSRRKAPFYKVMTGMPIAVDAFRYGAIPGVTAYFLTHAHSDHYTNLSSSWKTGPIYCSEGTANLIIHMLKVDRKWVHPLPMDVPTVIPNTGGVTVTLIEANHCPGSSLFLFEGKQTIDAGDSSYKSPAVGTGRTFRYLHCGDFRASPQHVLHPAVKGKKLDTIYLDTTYLNSKYLFPSQPQVISACAELARKLAAGEHVASAGNEKTTSQSISAFFSPIAKTEGKPAKVFKTLFVIGTYSIGKERIVKAVANALGTKVYCNPRKAAILRCQEDPELHAMLTKDPYAAGVHIVPLNVIASDRIKDYMDQWKNHWDKVIGFRPTGWTYAPSAGKETLPTVASVVANQPHTEFGPTHLQPMRNSTSTHKLFGVPYSEHSSFYELTCFSLSLDWSRIVATVNVGTEASRGKIAAWVAKWEAERKRRGGGVVPYRSPYYW